MKNKFTIKFHRKNFTKVIDLAAFKCVISDDFNSLINYAVNSAVSR